MLACRVETSPVTRLARAQLEPVKSRALLVADEVPDASVARQVLRKLGFATVTVPTLRQALALLAADSFSVVVLDLGRPDLVDGGALRAIEDAARATPIVVLCEASAVAERLRPWGGGQVHVLDRNALDLARLTAAIRFAAGGGLVIDFPGPSPRRSSPGWPSRRAGRTPPTPRRDRGWPRRG